MKSRFIFAIAINPHHHRSLLQNMHIMTDRSAKTRKPERKPHEIYQHPEPFIGRVLFRASSPPRGAERRESGCHRQCAKQEIKTEKEIRRCRRAAPSLAVSTPPPPHHRTIAVGFDALTMASLPFFLVGRRVYSYWRRWSFCVAIGSFFVTRF